MTPTIAIIGALEKEVRQIYTEVDNGTVTEEAGLKIVGGAYHGFNLVATTAGMGTVNVAAATQHLISVYGANAVIFSGIAGGLNPALPYWRHRGGRAPALPRHRYGAHRRVRARA